jgi:hypothetical protein
LERSDTQNNVKLTKDWIIGFVEGEGSFSNHTSRGKKIALFAITQKEKHIMEQIRNYFGFGILRERDNGVWDIYVQRYKDLCSIRDFFRGNLKTTSKQRQFERFSKILHEWGKRFDLHWHRLWTGEEIEKAKNMILEGHSLKELSPILNRSVRALGHKNQEIWHFNLRSLRNSDITGGSTFVSASGDEA